MFIDSEKMKDKTYAPRISQLNEWCQKNHHSSIPKLISYAENSGGICEDILCFFEENREIDIKRDLYVAFERLLAAGEPAKAEWYELLVFISQNKPESMAGIMMDEILSAYRASIPYEIVSNFKECSTVEEILEIRRYFEQSELKETIQDLTEEAEYLKQLYRDIHNKLDQASLENAYLKKTVKDLEKAKIHDEDSDEEETGRIEESELYDTMAQSYEAEEPQLYDTMARSEETEEPEFYGTMAQSEETEEPEFYGTMAQSEETEEPQLYDTMAQSYEMEGAESHEISAITVVEKNTSNPAIAFFVNIVKKIRAKRFQRNTELEKKREIAAVMTANQFEPERQSLVLKLLKSEKIPWEHIYSYVYDGASTKELQELVEQNHIT